MRYGTCVRIQKVQKLPKINKWVYTIKKEADNKLKYKARLVAAGYNQVNNFDFKELYSSVISIDAWRILIAIAAKKNLNV